MNIINTDKLHIKSWCNDLEEGALEQAKNLASLPFACKHIALMPDCHQGYGMPIGGVIATKGVIIPNAVGVDIGCGVRAIKTGIAGFSKSDIKDLMGKIRKLIPVGFNRNVVACNSSSMPEGDLEYQETFNEFFFDMPICQKENKNARTSLGTLGGGNHFIEIQEGSDGCLWIMIHTGSRNLGKKVADHYNKLAIELNDKWYSEGNPKHELAFLPLDSEEGISYQKEMQYCVDFALANRKKIGEIICGLIERDASIVDVIDIAHNYARVENHFGKNVVIHRKGATSARIGEVGIIPGSQGTKSYIVRGLGNPESFMSCSHGAGRKMGRKEAIRKLDLAEEIALLDNQGIIHGIRHAKDLDEAAGAYKDIESVMQQQKDLVSIIYTLTPIASVKG